MKKKLITLTLCCSLIFSLPFLVAAKPVDKLDQIVSLHGNGVTKNELRQEIVRMSNETGLMESQIIDQVLNELQRNNASNFSVSRPIGSTTKAGSVSTNSSGGEDGKFQLHSSRKGTFFYQPSATWFVQHGHMGMYYSTTTIVEAANADDGVRLASVSTRRVDSGSRIMTVASTTTTQDSDAAYWALLKLGNDYNSNFFNNRSCGGDSFNCSQLIWCAFKATVDIDIDDDGGWGVYPTDIVGSNNVNTLLTY